MVRFSCNTESISIFYRSLQFLHYRPGLLYQQVGLRRPPKTVPCPQNCCCILALCTPLIPLAPWRGHLGLGCQRARNVFLLPPQSVGSVYSGLMQGVGAAEKVFEFIDRQPTMVHDGSLAPDHLEGRVDFENVTFTYRTRPHTQVLQVREGLRPPPPLIIFSFLPSLSHLLQARPWQCSQEYEKQSPSTPGVGL